MTTHSKHPVHIAIAEVERQQRYKDTGGNECPVCGGQDIREDAPEWSDHGAAEALAYCACCSSTWTEVYQLAGYVNLKEERPIRPTEPALRHAELVAVSPDKEMAFWQVDGQIYRARTHGGCGCAVWHCTAECWEAFGREWHRSYEQARRKEHGA